MWYLNLEDPLEEVEQRLAAICIFYKITGEDIDGRLFIAGRETPIVIAETTKEGVQISWPLFKDLCEGIRTNGIDVLFIDPFVSCHSVPENDNGAIDRVAKTWSGIADAMNCSVDICTTSVNPAGRGARLRVTAIRAP